MIDQRLTRDIGWSPASNAHQSAWDHHHRAAVLGQELQGCPAPRCSLHQTSRAGRLEKSHILFILVCFLGPVVAFSQMFGFDVPTYCIAIVCVVAVLCGVMFSNLLNNYMM